jgi:hypothetical protein
MRFTIVPVNTGPQEFYDSKVATADFVGMRQKGITPAKSRLFDRVRKKLIEWRRDPAPRLPPAPASVVAFRPADLSLANARLWAPLSLHAWRLRRWWWRRRRCWFELGQHRIGFKPRGRRVDQRAFLDWHGSDRDGPRQIAIKRISHRECLDDGYRQRTRCLTASSVRGAHRRARRVGVDRQGCVCRWK